MIARLALTFVFSAALFAAKLGAESGALQQDGILKLLETSSASKESKSGQVKAKTSQMEDMVMLLAQQTKAAKAASSQDPVAEDSGEISGFVVQVKGEVANMLEEVFRAAGVANEACQAAYDNLTEGCPIYGDNTTFLPPGFTGDFESLRGNHKTCRSWLPEMKQEFESCHKIRDSLVGQEQALLDSFRDVNIFESPDECTISGDDVLAYYEAMREHFKNRRDTFWDTYYNLENVTVNITKFKCTEQEVAYYQKVADCESAQLKLEQTACELHDRTNESCHALPLCYDGKWHAYVEEMSTTNDTISDLKYEYRAIKRIQCLLDAFAADDMDAKIDECINKRHNADVINSTCVLNHETVEKPAYTQPEVCKNGVASILHPNDDNFNETEYASQGIVASRCLASCCTVDWYSWTTYGNAFVAPSHYLIDEETNMPAAFSTMEEAKAACEGMGSVHCFGIYDTKCDGASEESPVKLIASPGLDLHGVEESAIGSCIVHMALGSGTTTTTTVAELCTWEINISRAEESNSVWKSLTLEYQLFDETFRFSGCATSELPEAEACVSEGVANGVRVLKNRIGQGVGTGVCCGSETNKVLTATRVQCDGYLDKYTVIKDKYLTSTKLLRGTTYKSIEEAREACLRMGHACWGISDDKCDTVNFMLVDAQWNITEDMLLESKQHTCIYQKQKA